MISNTQTIILSIILITTNMLPTPPSTWSLIGLVIASISHWAFIRKNPLPPIVGTIFGILLLPFVEFITGANWLIYAEMTLPIIIFRTSYIIYETKPFKEILIKSRHFGRSV